MGTPRSSVDSKAIEQRFVRAGWELDGSFSEHLIVGHDGDSLSILDYPQAGETEEDPVFELIDHERNLTYGIQEIPSPSRPHSCSESTASHPRRTRTTTSVSRRRRFQRAAGRVRGNLFLPTCIGSGETVHNVLVLLARLCPSRKILFPILSN